MVICSNCRREYDDSIAMGVCPFCGFSEEVEDTDDVGGVKSDPRWLAPGTILNGRYEIIQVLGEGGFGITYKAIDTKTGTLKAVKEYFQVGVVNRMPGETAVFIVAPKRREEFEYGRDRLINEAKIVAKFQSPYIVRVDDYFLENNTSYMVMEYIDSQTLKNYLISQRRVLTPEEAVDIGVKISEALEEIHKAGVIHRDIAPDNLFIGKNGEIKIIDFGSARLSKEDTDERMITVKPGFAPPEQYEKIDPKNDRQKAWTDVYALGATIYQCLTGATPPESSDRKADSIAGQDRMQAPMEINSSIPEWLNNTILTAMAINTHERFKDTVELRTALLQQRKVLPIEKVRKRKRIRRTSGILASVLVIALVAVIGLREYEKKKKEVVLNPADITIWYVIEDDGYTDDPKSRFMNDIKDLAADSDRFSEVNIDLVGIPRSEYLSTLTDAYYSGRMPNLYEYPGEDGDYTQNAKKVSSVIKDKKNDCNYLNDYGAVFPAENLIPTGFNIPVIYVNTALATDYDPKTAEFSSVSEIQKLCDGNLVYESLLVDPALYDDYLEMFPDLASADVNRSEDVLQSFLEGADAVYFGSTRDYYQVRSAKALAGSYAMETVEVDRIICEYTNEWCVNVAEPDEDTAATALLAFMLENYAQDSLYLQTSIPGLPLEKQALAAYTTVRPSFSAFLDEKEMKKYTFK